MSDKRRKRGPKSQPIVTLESRNYVQEYFQRKLPKEQWVAELCSLEDFNEIESIIHANQSREDIHRLKAAIRKKRQYFRDKGQTLPPVNTRISGSAYKVISSLASPDGGETISDTIEKYLSPFKSLSRSSRELVLKQIEQMDQSY